MGPILQPARRTKEERNEERRAGPRRPAGGRLRAGELGTGRAPGLGQPAAITYMPSFEAAPAAAGRELREGSAGGQTGKTDTRAGRTAAVLSSSLMEKWEDFDVASVNAGQAPRDL